MNWRDVAVGAAFVLLLTAGATAIAYGCVSFVARVFGVFQ